MNIKRLRSREIKFGDAEKNYKKALKIIDKVDSTRDLKKAYEQAPDSPDILDSLALAYYKKGEPEKALPYAEKAVDLLGASSVANMHLGDIYKDLGRIREAQSQYEKALALEFDLTPELEQKLIERLK